MRLKFDRLINVRLSDGNSVTVPQDELWKVSIYTFDDSYYVSGSTVEKDKNISLFSKGTYIGCRTSHNNDLIIQGVAFKVVKEE